MRARRLGIAAAGALGTVTGVRRWYRRFDWQGEPDERLVAETTDGWRLGVARYRPAPGAAARPFPVVCCHGFAGTSLIYDLASDVSLARFLAGAGFDVYAVDLRGRGDSWPSARPERPGPEGLERVAGPDRSLHWSFDDFVDHDLPAAVELACEAAGAEQAFWIGLEMSGQAVYAAAISGTAGRVRGAVTLGAPVVTPPSAKVPGVTAPPRARRKGRIPFRAGASMAGPILAATGSRQLESSFRMAHTDAVPVSRYFRNGIPDESTVLADQFGDWVEHGVMRSLDGSTVRSERLDEVRLPVLALAAAADLQRLPDAVEATAKALGGGDVTFVRVGVSEGFSVDYGHDDLLVGRPAPAEVFPLIGDWLIERS
ncbi:MAG: alpha/beta fold hydrolase [Actinobacteria bacterium]|nr:alpha/beta fold hydrolase [Actinomycetota bacterium]